MIRVQLREMKEKCGYSNKKIAELSGVSLPTVNRIMSGQTDVPNFQTVCDLVIAMGGSLDELAGIQPKQPAQDEEKVEIYKEIIKEKDMWIKRLFVISCMLGIVLVGLLIFDITHPYIGFLRS